MQDFLKSCFNLFAFLSPAGRREPENYLPEWAKSQIASDLFSFSEYKLSKDALELSLQDARYLENPELMRFRIHNKKLSIQATRGIQLNERVVAMTKTLHRLCMRHAMPEVDFIVTLHDAFTYVMQPNASTFAPIFSFAKQKCSDKTIILIPDFEALRGYTHFLKNIECPWFNKKPLAVWRGTTTGGKYTEDNFFSFPRVRLVEFSKKHPKYLDARFNAHCLSNRLANQFVQMGWMGNSLSIDEQLQYKYQILIDGNSCAYSRAYWQLLSHSLIFKIDSENIQWYYGALKPYVHYVPVRQDLSDLIEKIEWAQSHEETALHIIANANEFARNNLNHKQVEAYLIQALMAYSFFLQPNCD